MPLEAIALLPGFRDRGVGYQFLDERFPVGDFLVAPVQPPVDRVASCRVQPDTGRKAHCTADIVTGPAPAAGRGNQIVRQRICARAVVVMLVNVFEQTADVLAQRIIDGQDRFVDTSALALGFALTDMQSVPGSAPNIPVRFRQEARKVVLLDAIQKATRHVRHRLVFQNHPSGQIIIEVPELTAVLKDRAKVGAMFRYDESRCCTW